MEEKMLLTTGNNFEGYYIDEYIDVISDEIVFRNSLMKQAVASVRDWVGELNIFDTEIKGASALIENGKKHLRERFLKKAKSIGGNAVLGMHVESGWGVEIVRVAISGTVVHILPNASKISESALKLSVKNSNHTPFRASNVFCKTIEDKSYISLTIYNPCKDNIMGIKCDVIFHTNLDEIYVVKDQVFINFEKQSDSYYASEPVIYTIPQDILKILDYTDIMVKKYNIDGSTVDVAYAEIDSKEDLSFFASGISQEFNALETLDVIKKMSNAKEIYEYIVSFAETDPNIIPMDLVYDLQKAVEIEKFYGNAKNTSLKAFIEKMGPFV